MLTLTRVSPQLDEQHRHQIATRAVAEAKRQAQAGRIPSRDLLVPRSSTGGALNGPATKVRLELTEVQCNTLTRGGDVMGDEMTFGGTAVLPDLTTRALGPFQLPQFQTDGEVQTFHPPLEVMTFALGPSFPQSCVVVLQACENDGLGGPERIPELLEEVVSEVKRNVQAALGVGQGQRGLVPRVIEEVGRIVDLMGERPDAPGTLLDELFTMMGQDHAFFTHESVAAVVESATAPFPHEGATSREHTVTFKRTGPLQKGDYTFRFRFAATSS